MRLTDFGGLDDLPSPPAPRATRAPRSRISTDKTAVPEVARGDMLLVAESLVEGRILLKRFKRYGLTIDWSREAAQALVMLKANPYRLVVIDRLKGDPDANQICRSAKQAKGPKGAPVVIMFAPTAGSMDRMKAGLAGSDAYLSRSVSESRSVQGAGATPAGEPGRLRARPTSGSSRADRRGARFPAAAPVRAGARAGCGGATARSRP